MVNLVIVSHGDLAEGLIDAMQLIVGQQEGVVAVSLKETDPIDGLTERVSAAIEEVGGPDGVLVLVDLFGASPFNISAQLTQKHAMVQVVTGVNLPMLLETALQREAMPLEELARLAADSGRNGIRTLIELME
jgi:mannose/fructose/sorbose-specific phosphotransferase system IIA component